MDFSQLIDEISPEFTQDVVYGILKKQTGLRSIKVTDIKIGAASKKGDSFLSNNRKFTIEVVGETVDGDEETKNVPFFVKYLLTNVARRKTFRSEEFFRNEANFYQKAWPILEKYRHSKGFTDKLDIVPTFYSAHIDGFDDYIALSDLTQEGFSVSTRSGGLDYEHILVILKAFASFHSLSLACKSQQKELFQQAIAPLNEVYYAEELRSWYGNYQKSLHVVVKDAIDKELSVEYSEKFSKLLADDFYGKVCKCCKIDGKFSAITQGDAWIPNFLIGYENEKPVKAALVDFQIARYTSLGTDLASFIYACAREDILEQWDDLIAFYYNTLTQHLEQYGVGNLFSLQELQEEVKHCVIYGMCLALEGLTNSLLDDEDVPNMDLIQGDRAVPLESIFVFKPFKDQKKRSRLANMFKHAVDRGFL